MIVGKENEWIDLKILKDLVYFSLLEICALFYLLVWEQGQQRMFVALKVAPVADPL